MYKGIAIIFLLFICSCSLKNIEISEIQTHEPITYYISNTGSDNNSGISKYDAWKSVDKVNSSKFMPGDKILFKGGETFEGKLTFNINNCKNFANNPLTISSYGSGKAIILAIDNIGIMSYNCSGIEITNLVIVGNESYKYPEDYNYGFDHSCYGINLFNFNKVIDKSLYEFGILFFNDLDNNIKLENILIENVEVSGFRDGGIAIASCNGTSGFRNVIIKNSKIFNNGDFGINIFGFYKPESSGYSHENVYISYNVVHDNLGIENRINYHTGSGIVVGNTQNSVVEHNVAFNNGINNYNKNGGPFGIWAWDTDNIIIQHNESYSNKTGTIDGGGFDLDGGTTNSIVQYNYSHENYGSGFAIGQFWGAREMKNNVIRYNISENDARKGWGGAIFIFKYFGVMKNIYIHNNTVYIKSSKDKNSAALVSIGSQIKNMKIFNNIFTSLGRIKLLHVSSNDSEIDLLNNNYYSYNNKYYLTFNGETYSSLNTLSNNILEEFFNTEFSDFNLNPQFESPGNGGVIGKKNELYKLTAYKLTEESLMIDSGIDSFKFFGIDNAPLDFHGSYIPKGSNYDIGAHEW